MVTIQLPMYNESFVVERLIDRVVQMNYPKDKLEIQILDDSNDSTIEKAKAKVEQYQLEGIDIQYIRRDDRVGFKAGALDYGLKTAKGEFVAIFDADFLPSLEFLNDAIPYFVDEKVGVVQSRWTYINENYSFLTRIQTVVLNTHFSVEQQGRNRSGAYINFNGTAGIWRTACIADAGGWHADTLTEDLDLSFRAQIKKWKFVFAKEIESPSELPVTLPGYKVQQFRWSKGAAECARKNIPGLLKSKTPSFWAKMIGSFHLLNSSMYLIIMAFILLSVPMTYVIQDLPDDAWIYNLFPLFLSTNLILFIVFAAGSIANSKNKVMDILRFPFIFIGFISINMGISLYMSLGIIEGYIGKKSDFIRTPKFNITEKKKVREVHNYGKIKISPLLVFEFLLMCYGIFQTTYALTLVNIPMAIFGLMFTAGFGIDISFTLYHSSKGK
ncbi:MAG: cellulose synthase/poly-beta-1,6-N-acetylglucosamine synthase-like glycosyltransferase [Flavobacteriaceae bacterium]|jgi:cellulose synthase/poly-beta-1,6-N-acetylglucosamine synthase-like glycosyltransferase